MSESFTRTLADVRAAYAAVQGGALGKTRWVREGASSRTVTVYGTESEWKVDGRSAGMEERMEKCLTLTGSHRFEARFDEVP